MPLPDGSTLAPPAPSGAAAPGAVPPHSIEAEQAVLGAILLSEQAHYTFVVEESLKAEDFYRGRHRAIFDAMLALFERSGEIDVLSVTEELKSRGTLEDAGGADEVGQLVTAVPAVGNLRRYAEIVKQLAHLRRLLDASYRIQSSVLGREGEPRDILEAAERTILEIRDGDGGEDFRPVGDVLHHEITRWQDLSRSGTQLTGVPSGFDDLDTITGGFQPGNLIILAARPSMGKSALVTNIAENGLLGLDRMRRDRAGRRGAGRGGRSEGGSVGRGHRPGEPSNATGRAGGATPQSARVCHTGLEKRCCAATARRPSS